MGFSFSSFRGNRLSSNQPTRCWQLFFILVSQISAVLLLQGAPRPPHELTGPASLTSLAVTAKPCGVFKPSALSNETLQGGLLWEECCFWWKASVFWPCYSYLLEAKRKWKFLFTLLWETPTNASDLFLKGPALVPSGVHFREGVPDLYGTGFGEELLHFEHELGVLFSKSSGWLRSLNPSLEFSPVRSQGFSVLVELSQNVRPWLKSELWSSSLWKLGVQTKPFWGSDVWAEGSGHLNHSQRNAEGLARHTRAYMKSNQGLDCLHESNFDLGLQFSSVQLLSRVWLFATPWITARQASLSNTNPQSLLKLMPIKSVMPSSHLILCRPLLLLPPIPLSIRVFSKSQLFTSHGQSIGVSASASVLPMNTHNLSPLGWPGWISLQSKGLSRVFSNTTV